MKFTITFKVDWEKGTESLVEFRKKLDAMKAHASSMQIKGLLPRGEIYWVIGRAKDQPVWGDRVIRLPAPAEQLCLPPCLHSGGDRLDV